MKKIVALLLLVAASAVVAAACAKSSQGTSSSSSAAPQAAASMGMASGSNTAMTANLPIPLSKLPSEKLPPGNAARGAKLYAANCEACHGAGGKNGTVGPSLAGIGITAGQVAYMVQHPQGVDKQSGMPDLHLPANEVADIAAYVASLK